jgi:hypothetical protein
MKKASEQAFPVPVSPQRRTGGKRRAPEGRSTSRAIWSRSACIAWLSPMNSASAVIRLDRTGAREGRSIGAQCRRPRAQFQSTAV